MADWKEEPWEWFNYYWTEFVEWFEVAPLTAQILVIIGIFTVIALTIILVYYIAKGICYILTSIGKGIYKLFKGISTAIEGKPKESEESPQSQENQQLNYKQQKSIERVNYKFPEVDNIKAKSPGQVSFCSECGNAFSEKVINTINSRGYAFCQQCGNKYEVNPIQIQI